MPINRTVENSLRNVDPTPLYAVVGAGDILVEKLRDAREEVQARGGGQNADHPWDPRTLSAALQAAAAARVETVTAEVRARTADAKSLPDQATVMLTGAVAQAIMTYAELAHRGRDVVARVRGCQATSDSPTATASSADTSTADTWTADTSPVDASMADTSPVDTSIADTSPVDTPTSGTSTGGTSPADPPTTTDSLASPPGTSTEVPTQTTRAAKSAAASTTKRAKSTTTTRKSSAPGKKTSEEAAEGPTPEAGP